MPNNDLTGAVLLDQTMVSDAARLLQGIPDGLEFPDHLLRAGMDPALSTLFRTHQRRWPVRNVERLMSLSALCDAILLYDRLYVLTCQLPVDAEELVLRNELFDLGILEEITVGAHKEPIADELASFLGTADATRSVPRGGRFAVDEVHEAIRRSLVDEDESTEYGRISAMVDAFRDEIEGTVAIPARARSNEPPAGEAVATATVDPLLALGRQVVEDISYFGSGSVFRAVSGLRTFVYWRLSARLNVPFYPSCRRLPAYHLIASHVDRNVREQVYGAVAEAFNTTVGEVYSTENSMPVYVPPAVAIFLDELRTEGDISRALVNLRTRHQPLRDAFRELQESGTAGATLRELHQRRGRLAKVVTELRTPGDVESNAVLENVVDLLPDVVKAGTNPLDVTNYSQGLVRKPVGWIQHWWRRRPYRFAFRLRDRALNLSHYDSLLFDAVGVRISDREFADFGATYGSYLDGFTAFQPARQPGSVVAPGQETG